MKILQWNIWWRECVNNLNGIIAELKKHDADIVCLQEVSYIDDKNFLNPLLELYPYPAFAVADTLKNHIQGNCILSKFPITNFITSYIQQPKDLVRGYDNEGRIYLECELDIGNNQKLCIGTTHSSYTDRFVETPVKDLEIDNLLKLLNGKKEKFIFAGDLNTIHNSNYIRKISKHLNNISPDFSQNTWTTKPFHHNDFSEESLNWRLDYIFATPDIEAISHKIISTNLSDHLPVLTEIK